MLAAQVPGQDSFIAQLNDLRLYTKKYGKGTVAAIWPAESGDNNQLLILYENGGRDNGGGIDARCGLHDPSVSTDIVLPQTLADWKIQQEQGDPAADVAADLDDSSWPAVKFDRGGPIRFGRKPARFSGREFDLTPMDLKTSHESELWIGLKAIAPSISTDRNCPCTPDRATTSPRLLHSRT